MVKKSEPGLSSLNQSRRTRHRQLVTGKAAIGGGISPRLFGIGFAFLVVGGLVYYRQSAAKLEGQRGALLAEQRAVEATLGPKLRPLRDVVEARAGELLKREGPPLVKSGVDFAGLLRSPGIYLRARLDDVLPVETFRKAAMGSLRDGFTSCLTVDPRAAPPGVGKACKGSADCAPGELCTEFGACQRPSSPFNMRFLYRAMSILEPAWVDEVKTAKNDFGLLAHSRMLESITKVDVPLAIEVYQRARFALVVLDEPAEPGLATGKPDVGETPGEFLQRQPHVAKVGLWSLPGGEWLAYLRTDATGELRDVGQDRAIGGAESLHARARLANSCGLALELKAAIAKGSEPSHAPPH